MICDAVLLTYLEWVRLVSCGWLRLHNARVMRCDGWNGPLAKLHFDALMESAPDVGMSATDYVVAELKYEVWPPLSMHDLHLGRVLNLDQVMRFSCFNESANQVMNATYNGPSKFTVQLFEQPVLWSGWHKRVSHAAAENRAERLLAHLNVPAPSERFKEETTAVFVNLPEAHHKSKGTKAFGWVTALAIPRQNLILSDKHTQASEAVQSSVKNLQTDFQVNISFFSGISTEIANQVFTDPQYEKICRALVVCATYVHYSYLMQRSNYRDFAYDAFIQDVTWLNEKHIDLAAQLVDKIARDMPDELLLRIILQNPKISVFKKPAIATGVPSKEVSDTRVDQDSVNKSDQNIEAAGTPENKSSTDVNLDNTSAAPEGSNNPSAGHEAIDETLAQPETTNPEESKDHGEELVGESSTGIDQKPTSQLIEECGVQGTLLGDRENEDCPQTPNTGAEGTPNTAAKRTRRTFTPAYQQDVVKKIRQAHQQICDDENSQVISQSTPMKALQQVCRDEKLELKKVKSWVKDCDIELAKLLE